APLRPQQNTCAESLRPQVCNTPAAMAVKWIPPDTIPGTESSAMKDPLPSCPNPPKPQQRPVPRASSAQVCESPAETARNVYPPDTATGVALGAVEPLPSCPCAFAPQHIAWAVGSRAQVCVPPLLTAPVVDRLSAAVGLSTPRNTPPRCPARWLPQQYGTTAWVRAHV